MGSNEHGQLGLGNIKMVSVPTLLSTVTSKVLKAKSISYGTYHTIIIDLNNNIWVMGDNSKGQFGLGDYNK